MGSHPTVETPAARIDGAGRALGYSADCSLLLTHRWPAIAASSVASEVGAASGRPLEQAAIGKEFIL